LNDTRTFTKNAYKLNKQSTTKNINTVLTQHWNTTVSLGSIIIIH